MGGSVAARLLTKVAAAAYCSISVETFDRLKPAAVIVLQKGHKRLNRYDVADLDQWIESLKGSGSAGKNWLDRLGKGVPDHDDGQDARH